LIGSHHQVNKKEADEEFPEKEDDLLNSPGQPIENELDDDQGPPFIHGGYPYEDSISDEDRAQLENPWKGPVKQVATHHLQQYEQNEDPQENGGEP
jgi:hypothetical protein